VIGFLLLLTGAALNDQRGEESVYFGYYYCYVVKPGVFAGGAILSLASAAFGIVYYISLTEKKNGIQYPYPNQGVIAMAQPQIPSQTNQDPVFVHEDTYVRRQFTWLVHSCVEAPSTALTKTLVLIFRVCMCICITFEREIVLLAVFIIGFVRTL